MELGNPFKTLGVLALFGALAGCGQFTGLFERQQTSGVSAATLEQRQNTPIAEQQNRTTIFSLFQNQDDPNVTLEVNKYIWNATLEILDFMPIRTADPFTGVIVYGPGTPPGTGRSYSGTVYVQDPALDARSLRVALRTSSGPVSLETTRAVEDAILTRARELRIRDTQL
ncbi:MAG: DUF3576 domain-containing protein [Pseudomonadota bacterium]